MTLPRSAWFTLPSGHQLFTQWSTSAVAALVSCTNAMSQDPLGWELGVSTTFSQPAVSAPIADTVQQTEPMRGSGFYNFHTRMTSGRSISKQTYERDWVISNKGKSWFLKRRSRSQWDQQWGELDAKLPIWEFKGPHISPAESLHWSLRLCGAVGGLNGPQGGAWIGSRWGRKPSSFLFSYLKNKQKNNYCIKTHLRERKDKNCFILFLIIPPTGNLV